jgi:hypothetical protein
MSAFVIEPITVSGEGATRASTATYTNSAGQLATAAVNELRFQYDPLDLAAPPVVLVEKAATNLETWSQDYSNAAYTKVGLAPVTTANAGAPDGSATLNWLAEDSSTGLHAAVRNVTISAGQTYVVSRVFRAAQLTLVQLLFDDTTATNGAYANFNLADSTVAKPLTVIGGGTAVAHGIKSIGAGLCLAWIAVRAGGVATTARVAVNLINSASAGAFPAYAGVPGNGLLVWGSQTVLGASPSSYIPTTSAAATRAADVLGTGVLLYSNVPENEYPVYSATGVYGPGDRVISAHDVHEQLLGTRATVTLSIASPCVVTHAANGFANGQPVKLTTTDALPTGLTAGATCYVINVSAGAYQLSATVGGPAINTSGAQSGVHTLTANAIGQAPSGNSLYWVRKGVSNQRMMFDEFNNTATLNADVIRVVLQPRAVAGGLFLGGVVGVDTRVTMVEPNGSTVKSATIDLLRPTAGRSYFNWMFSRIKRTTMVVLSDLPAYYDGVLMVEIRNPGGVAACAMLAIGPVTNLGLAHYGVSRDITDYSSETFNVDGSSISIPRPFSKGMDLDIEISNSDIAELTELVESFHQRFLIWVAEKSLKNTVVAGKYTSLRTVIPNKPKSVMSLSIKGKI